ncbi:MAG: hypothetical protein Tsb009_07790 [Planctomycetaceae bacterium]
MSSLLSPTGEQSEYGVAADRSPRVLPWGSVFAGDVCQVQPDIRDCCFFALIFKINPQLDNITNTTPYHVACGMLAWKTEMTAIAINAAPRILEPLIENTPIAERVYPNEMHVVAISKYKPYPPKKTILRKF